MADAWGLSWGLASSAWGGSWGRVASSGIEHVGDGVSKKRRRRRKHEEANDLFRDMERTLRSVMAGETADVLASSVAPVVETGKRFADTVTHLKALSEDSEILSRRLATLQADIAAYEQAKQQEMIEQDDEDWMMFL